MKQYLPQCIRLVNADGSKIDHECDHTDPLACATVVTRNGRIYLADIRNAMRSVLHYVEVPSSCIVELPVAPVAAVPAGEPEPEREEPVLMETKYTVLHPDGTVVNGIVQWPEYPGYDAIRELTNPILGGESYLERVVWRTSTGHYADMLVDEDGIPKGLPVNPAATTLYQHDWCIKNPGQNPNFLPSIFGVVIVFERKVWY